VALGVTALPQAAPGFPPPRIADFEIVASGDLLIHGSLDRQAARGGGLYDFRPFFARIRPLVQSAALAVCHVEHPIGAGRPSTYPIFNAPPALAAAVRWTGWDVCSTASNHTTDRGQRGVETTLLWLDRAHVAHAGSARSEAEARRITLVRVQGVTVAFLAYAYGSNTAIPRPYSVNIISDARIVADAGRARRLGADLVLVNLHWGDEYVHDPSAEQRRLARRLLCGGVVDAIVGQHVHVVQPIRGICGRFVVFGEGNLVSGQQRPETQDGLIALLHVRARPRDVRITGVRYVPTHVRQPDHVVEPASPRSPSAGLRASFWRTVAHAGHGKHVAPLVWNGVAA
jgi:poly-gamma-glutamate synthesis protein (capsule biosynthesis protein)